MDPGPEVVCVSDHGRAGRPGDRGLDLLLDGGQAARDDLQEDWVRWSSRLRSHIAPIRRLPSPSTLAAKPGWTGTVAPNSSMMAGPATSSPASSAGRQ